MKIIMEPHDLARLMHAAADEALCELGEWNDDDDLVIDATKLDEKSYQALLEGAVRRAGYEEMYGFERLMPKRETEGQEA